MANAVRSIFELPMQDQHRLHVALGRTLEGPAGEESQRDRELRLRVEAADAMKAAADALGLLDGTAPTTKQYKEAARNAELLMTFGAVYAVCENRWEIATDFYEGRTVPLTAAQRSLRRVVLGSERTHVPALECVRQFLAQTPPEATAVRDYKAWAAETKARRDPSEPKLLVTDYSVMQRLRLS